MILISQRLVNSRLCRLRCRWGCARYPEVSGYALNLAVIIYASRPVLRTTLQICVAFSGGIASLRPRLLPRIGRNQLKVHTLRSTIPRTKKA